MQIIASHNASVELAAVKFTTADVTRTSVNGTDIRLTELSPDTPSYTRIAYGQIDLGGANEVRFASQASCDAGDGLLRLSALPTELIVNGKILNVQEVRQNPSLTCVQIDAQ